jgi:hypothetical protein
MFSDAGSKCADHVRRKRSFDRSITRLEFMAALWREDEDSHATLLALLCYLYGQIQMWLSLNRTNGLSFEDLARAMECFKCLSK